MTASSLTPLLRLVRLVESRYPQWVGFGDPRFVKDALSHKPVALAKATAWLNSAALHDLQRADQPDEILAHIQQLAAVTHWLYLNVPKTGDLNLLYQGINKTELCEAFIELLHGAGDSPTRLARFLDFVSAMGASPQWAFPTCFLALAHPNTDVFIKPSLFKPFLDLLGESALWSATPSRATYANLLQVCRELKTQLAAYGATDMLDVHGFIWAAVSQSERKPKPKRNELVEFVEPVGVREPAPHYVVTSTPPSQAPATHIKPSYSLTQCAAETGLAEATLTEWCNAIQRKGQAIVYGPPGTGKTFVAQKLARHLVDGDESRIEIVQFHPAYSYEEFMQGMRPKARADGTLDYPLVDGRFVQFCKSAHTSTSPSVLVIDEINRANVSRVFGELMFLLEYRDQQITLAGGERFSIPRNVILLGTMNTADRSIALVDHALRRRFAFLALHPNYDLLRRFHANTTIQTDVLIHLLQQINTHIGDANYYLGPSFFLVSDFEAQLPSIWQTEIEPYLEEYFFDKPDVVDQFRWEAIRGSLFRG